MSQQSRSFHILMACHQVDKESMQAVLTGMEAHSDLWMFYMNDVFAVAETFNGSVKPVLEVWHGYAGPKTAWKTWLELLESAEWKVFSCVQFVFEEHTGLLTRASLSEMKQLYANGYFGQVE